MDELTEFELDVLRAANGESVPGLGWGAAMAAAIEYLRERGLVSGYSKIEITTAGKAAIGAQP